MDIVKDLAVLSEKADATMVLEDEEQIRKWFELLFDEATSIMDGSKDILTLPNINEFLTGVEKKNKKKRASSFLKRDHLHERRSSRRIAKFKALEEKPEETAKIQSPPLFEEDNDSVKIVELDETNKCNGTFVCTKTMSETPKTAIDDNMKTPPQQILKEDLKDMFKTKVIKSSILSPPKSEGLQNLTITKQSSKSKLVALSPPKKLSSLKNLSILKENRMERAEKPNSLAKITKLPITDPKKLKIEENKKKRALRMQQNQELRQKVEQERERTKSRLRAKEEEKAIAAKKVLDAKKQKNEVAVINKTTIPNSLQDKKVKTTETTSVSKGRADESNSNGKIRNVHAPIIASTPKEPTPINKPIQEVIASASNTNEKSKGNSHTMSPADSSFVSYDISEIKTDSEDEEDVKLKPKKRVPNWASGLNLQNSVINQFYNAMDTDKFFGTNFGTMDLSSIMGVRKMTYKKRTSSAIWNTTIMNKSVIGE